MCLWGAMFLSAVRQKPELLRLPPGADPPALPEADPKLLYCPSGKAWRLESSSMSKDTCACDGRSPGEAGDGRENLET